MFKIDLLYQRQTLNLCNDIHYFHRLQKVQNLLNMFKSWRINSLSYTTYTVSSTITSCLLEQWNCIGIGFRNCIGVECYKFMRTTHTSLEFKQTGNPILSFSSLLSENGQSFFNDVIVVVLRNCCSSRKVLKFVSCKISQLFSFKANLILPIYFLRKKLW